MIDQKLKVRKHHFFLLFVFLLINCSSFAQGDPYEEEDYVSIFDESDMYISDTHKPSRSQETETDIYGGYLGINLPSPEKNKNQQDHWQTPAVKQPLRQTPLNKQDPRQTEDAPPPPPDPDVPINGGIAYLIAIGLGYGGYKIRKEHIVFLEGK